MAGRVNRPTCRLCQAESERKLSPVRIGVWVCKRHWRDISAYVERSQYTGYNVAAANAIELIRRLDD